MIEHEQRQQLILLRLKQAHDTIGTSVILIEAGEFRGALNRLYYAMFYAVLALALHENFQTSKHAQLLGWFNKHFVKTGIFEHSMFEVLRKAFDRRNEADYEIKPLPESLEMQELLENATVFVAHIVTYLQK